MDAMELTYETWRGVMYCVGVFVTCNVGGAALRCVRDCASRLMKPRAAAERVSGDGGHKDAAAEPEPAAVTETESADGWKPQSFEEIQREIRQD